MGICIPSPVPLHVGLGYRQGAVSGQVHVQLAVVGALIQLAGQLGCQLQEPGQLADRHQSRAVIAGTFCLRSQLARFLVQSRQLGKQIVGVRDVLRPFRLHQEFGQVVALVPENRISAHREILRYAAIRSAIGYQFAVKLCPFGVGATFAGACH